MKLGTKKSLVRGGYLMENEFKYPEVLELLRKKLSGDKSLMNAIAETMRTAVLKNFETEGARLGKKWQPLSLKTWMQRKKKGYTGPILQRTGQLKRSIVSSYGDNYAQVSTNLIYAAIHHYGGEAARNKKVKIPARPFMVLNDNDIEKIRRKIIASLKGV